jgi:hypothetical protein
MNLEKPSVRLSLKSTKEEMLKAYNDLVARFQEKAATSSEKQVEAKKTAEAAVVEKASSYTVESIIKGLANVNIYVGKALTDLSRELTAEAGKLTEIREAIAIETKHLEELHDIRLAADTLANLIQDHTQKKAAFEVESEEERSQFEADMAARRAEWKKEQEVYNATLRENEAKLKKEREREREEYEYNLTLARKKDKDLYEEQKANLLKALKEERLKQEQELSARETAVVATEAELSELRAKVAAFPAELSAAVERTEREVLQRSDARAKLEEQLRSKEVEGDKRVAELRIAALEETVKRQLTQIEGLTKKLEEANVQVQAIAVKAIEGASNSRALNTINEIAMEQAKNIRDKR